MVKLIILNGHEVSAKCLAKIKKPAYFIIQFIFVIIYETALFGTIHKSHCIISANFYFYLQYFQQKVFSFNKISGFQADPCAFGSNLKNQLILLFSLFLLIFMSSTALFGIIHGFHYTISVNFYLNLQYFQ